VAESLSISDAEWHVMNVVWRDQPVEASRVVDQLAAAHGWSVGTIKTMLHRLTKKGALAFDRDGKRYLYRATVDRAATVRQASRSFLDRVFGGAWAPALLQLVDDAKLTETEVAELRQLLDDKDASR
jgi:BlaI family penicillinase repressor